MQSAFTHWRHADPHGLPTNSTMASFITFSEIGAAKAWVEAEDANRVGHVDVSVGDNGVWRKFD